MISAQSILMAAALVSLAAGGVCAHDEDLRSGQLKITVGKISDEVALARLKTAGVQNSAVVRRDDNKLILRGEVEGRSAEIEVDVMSGHAVDLGANRRTLIGPQGTFERPQITGRELPVDHHDIARPELMRNAIHPRQE
jgi:hypothetical protein